MDICKETVPEQKEIEPGHFVVCHLYDDMKEVVRETPKAQEKVEEAVKETN